jgi:hypothetical protein
VGRQHAIVEDGPDGRLLLRCHNVRDWIECDGQQVRELPLGPGLRFRIGPAEFECRAAPTPAPTLPTWLAACPACGSRELPQPSHGPQTCTDCGAAIMVCALRDGEVVCLPQSVESVEAAVGGVRGTGAVGGGRGHGTRLRGT